MKPDFEKMARNAAMALPPSDFGSHRAIMATADVLREAYTAGYRDGQELMLAKIAEWGGVWEADFTIEDP